MFGGIMPEVGKHTDYAKPLQKEQPSTPMDAVPAKMCLRCGLTGPHPDSNACIEELRDRLATVQFALTASRHAKSIPRYIAG